jgi:hypothetical protein
VRKAILMDVKEILLSRSSFFEARKIGPGCQRIRNLSRYAIVLASLSGTADAERVRTSAARLPTTFFDISFVKMAPSVPFQNKGNERVVDELGAPKRRVFQTSER